MDTDPCKYSNMRYITLDYGDKFIIPPPRLFFIPVVMERVPGSLDDLQPQDLSTSSISTVIDLTRNGEECVSSIASLNSLVKSPAWCANPSACNPQLTLPESPGSSDINLQSENQIHPDDALSHTTVTLSYVSRSHVCTTHDLLSQHLPLSGLPAISLLPLGSPRDSEPLREPNQHYSEQVEQPVDLNVSTKHFQSPSQAQRRSEDNNPSHEVKSDIISRDMDEPFQEEHSLSQKNSLGLENGKVGGWQGPHVSARTSPEPAVPAPRDSEETGGCEDVFDVSTKPDPVVIPDSIGVRNLFPLNRISPLDDPVSPSVTSQDGVEDVVDLPQAASSPSTDNCYPDTTGGLVWAGSCSERANRLGSRLMGSESSHRDEQPVQKQNAVSEPLIGATGDACLSDDPEHKPVSAHINGNATALQRILNEKKLAVRSSRGTQLESIVLDISSSSCKVSGCIHTNKKPSPFRVAECDAKITSSESNGKPSLQKRTSSDKASLFEDTVKQTVIPAKKGNDDNSNADSNHDSTSDSRINHSEMLQNSTPPKSPRPAVCAGSTEQPEQLSSSDPAVEISAARVSPRTQSSKSPKKIKGKTVGSGAAAKTAGNPRSRRKTHKGRNRSQCASVFSPQEPEIKLRYITYKGEKRDLRVDSFSPFVHVERQQSALPLCTVVNYPEEARTDLKTSQQMPPGSFATGAVPSTSCLQLGRASAHSQHQRSLVCCLCGQSANAMDLGDLHGPYYPEGHQPATKRAAGAAGLKEEEEGEDSDSDSSSSTIKERGRKRAVQPWASDGTGGPPAKRALSDVSEEWYSAPVLPLEPCEYWLHEDCGIWSAGVYLVKGKVYGLEEAFRVAQETVAPRLRPFVDLHRLSVVMDFLSSASSEVLFMPPARGHTGMHLQKLS